MQSSGTMRSFILSILLLSIPFCNAQTLIRGNVASPDGELLVGANIYLLGTYDGAFSDSIGNFFFSSFHTDTASLIISYLGYETYKKNINPQGDTLIFKVVLEPSQSSLSQVTITAGAFEASDEKKGVILRPLDIVTTAGALADIATALNTLPGTQNVGEEGQLFVRGGAAYETKTFIDGMEVLAPYGSTVPDVPARGRFSPFLFKGTLFSTGGYSAAYGQALSSALILETQDLPEESVTGISLLSVGTELSHTQRWDRSSIAASVNYGDLGPYFQLSSPNLDWSRTPQSWGGALSFRHQDNNAGVWKSFLTYNHARMGLEFPHLDYPDQTDFFTNINDNYYLNSTYKGILAQKWMLEAGISGMYDDEKQGFLWGDIDTRQYAGELRGVLKRDLNSGTQLRLGANSIHSYFNEEFNSPDFIGRTELNDWLSAAFAELDWKLGNRWAFRTGLRTEHSSLLERINIAPRASMAYKLSEYGQFSLAYGHYYQRPQYEWLRVTQELNFERADHYIFNYQWNKDNRILRLEAYYKDYNRLATFDSNLGFQPEAYANSGAGYAKGFDIFWRDRKSITYGDYWISYSYLDTRRSFGEFTEAIVPTFASKHNLSVVAKYFVPGISSQIGMTYQFASARNFENPNQPGILQGRTIPFHNLSANISYLTSLWGQYTIVYASATNLPGFKQVFGYRYGNVPDDQGSFRREVIGPPAQRFFFLGILISITKANSVQP